MDGNPPAKRRAISKSIHLPNESWTQTLEHCDRESLASRVSLANWLFHTISRPVIDIAPNKQRKIKDQLVFKKVGPTCVLIYEPTKENLEIAEVEPPENVCSFGGIELMCFEPEVVRFFSAIRRLLNDICVIFTGGDLEENLQVLKQLLNMFPDGGRAITSLDFGADIAEMEQEFIESLLTTDVKRVNFIGVGDKGDAKIALLFKWLFANGHDDVPKFAIISYDETAEGLRKHFGASKQSAGTFLAFMKLDFDGEVEEDFDFNTEQYNNVHTGQQMTLQKGNGANGHLIIAYCRTAPKDKEEATADETKYEQLKQKMATWEQQDIAKCILLNIESDVGKKKKQPQDVHELGDSSGPSGSNGQ